MNLNDLPIVAEVDAELSDEDYEANQHGTAYCYNKGCKGPICKKGNRDRRRATRGSDLGPAPLDQYLDFRLTQHEATRKKQPA